MQFDLSARASVRIRIGLLPFAPLRAGSIRLFGGFGSSVFAKLAATASAEFIPSTLMLPDPFVCANLCQSLNIIFVI